MRSKQFDDVYFSAQDGLGETRHVFLAGNNLPDSWVAREVFTIAETGFGTGLNFLAVWKLWEETPVLARPGRLEYISYEKYPLTLDEIRVALSPWENELGSLMERFFQFYPEACVDICKFNLNENIHVTLIFGDVNEAMPETEALVDCWFLDGFKPSANPDMWSETVFREMARMSRAGASFATFTSAGFVRRGLSAAGFKVQKVPGFGRKREMLVGRFEGAD